MLNMMGMSIEERGFFMVYLDRSLF